MRLGLSLLVVLAVIPSQARSAEPIAIERQRNITYCITPEKELKLDLAMPKGDGPYPAIVCVHGGAWRLGNRKDMSTGNELFNDKSLTDELAKRGYVAISISYRLIHDAIFPAMIQDCRTAVRWLRANAAKYHIDPEKIGAVGFSAGGHLASLMGLADEDQFTGPDYPKESMKLQAVVDFYGPSDLTRYLKDRDSVQAVFAPMLGGTIADKPDAWKSASPVTHVRKGAPPFLIMHGTADKIVAIDHSRDLAERLKQAGGNVELVELKGRDHGWIGKEANRTLEMTIDFFDKHLKP